MPCSNSEQCAGSIVSGDVPAETRNESEEIDASSQCAASLICIDINLSHDVSQFKALVPPEIAPLKLILLTNRMKWRSSYAAPL